MATMAELEAQIAQLRAQLTAQTAQPTKAPAHAITHRSTQAGPVRITWELAEANPGMRRCDVIRLAEAAGVATYTARTQYQRWFSWVGAGRPERKQRVE